MLGKTRSPQPPPAQGRKRRTCRCRWIEEEVAPRCLIHCFGLSIEVVPGHRAAIRCCHPSARGWGRHKRCHRRVEGEVAPRGSIRCFHLLIEVTPGRRTMIRRHHRIKVAHAWPPSWLMLLLRRRAVKSSGFGRDESGGWGEREEIYLSLFDADPTCRDEWRYQTVEWKTLNHSYKTKTGHWPDRGLGSVTRWSDRIF